MMRKKAFGPLLALLLTMALAAGGLLQAQSKITPPTFGEYTVGDDYFLAKYTQLQEYWNTLAKQSDRMKLVEIAKTAEGRPMMMAIITSPENHRNLARYKDISRRLALAEGLTADQARALATEGKAVVWIDGGLHATECINAQGLFRMAYEMVSRTDPETMRILDKVILLLAETNPDGMELVSNWYMREPDPAKRTIGGLPVLYHKYVGHDNNRDSYTNYLPETAAISRQMYIEWMPQIIYNQHQSGPAGAILFTAPYRDPFNYLQDPLFIVGIDMVAGAIHSRLITENKPGAVMRNAGSYSTWFNGSVRTSPGFHNIIEILTETIGNPTPMEVPLIPARLLPDGNQPFPVTPGQRWHQRQSIEYVISVSRAILDIAARMSDDFLFRIYRMGKNSIERGSQDTWTLTPKRLAAMQAAIAKDGVPSAASATGVPLKYYQMLRDPALRDPREYIIPSDQPDFLTGTRFVNALMKSGVAVHRATSSFQVAGKTYPAGSYVVKAAQAFRAHVLDMFEPQDHPNDFAYPGGPPKQPYDVAGYTLAYQMGVEFDRILDGFDGPFEKIPDLMKPPAGRVTQVDKPVGYLLSHQFNDAFLATTRLLAAGEDVYWLKNPFTGRGKSYPAGTIYIPAKASTHPQLDKLASEVGLVFEATPTAPTGDALKLKPVRVGLWDQYGGSMPSGWIRWLFEQVFPMPYELVFAPALDAGNLKTKYDVLIFPDGAIPERDAGARRGSRVEMPPPNVPNEYKDRIGNVTVAKTIPQLRTFIEEGGTVLAVGSSSSIGYYLDLPIANHLIERKQDGTASPLSSEKYYVPGSVLMASVDNTNPLAYGMPNRVDVMFDNSPVFHLQPEAALRGVRPLLWFSSAQPLRSGWAWGQHYLQGGIAALEAGLGKGRVVLYGPDITFRAQPHGTFKMLFNGIYLAGAVPVKL